ncbi:NFACT RNA binding domain-containing protein, partial [bacterium]|nr:NFACT RNA binding domain-containing protein [bacterium]
PPPSRPAREEAVRDFGAGSIALAAGRYFADRAAEREIDDARREIGAFLARARKRTTGYLDKLRRELSAEDDPAVLRDKADHLAANLHAVKPRMDTLAMPRFDGAGDIHIPLDPAVSPQQNLERLYARARRTKKRIEAGRARVGEMETHAARLADFEVRLSGAGDADAIARIRDEMIGQGVIPRPRVKRSAAPVRAKRRDKEASRAARRFTSHDGLEILVGKSASDNDEVTFRLARGNDWWFHVQGHGGSHVIARARKEGDLPTETLLDAASLAVMHSKLSRQGAGEVLYTRRKNVRKRKGAPPGQVTAEHTRTIFVRIEKARIDRLFAGSGQGET